jgi:hypothetical protein
METIPAVTAASAACCLPKATYQALHELKGRLLGTVSDLLASSMTHNLV